MGINACAFTTQNHFPIAAPSAAEIQREVARRQAMRADYLKMLAAEISQDRRPKKPAQFKSNYAGMRFLGQLSGAEANLTAHHILPFKKLKQEFVAALTGDNIQAMRGILAYSAEFPNVDSSEAWRFFSKRKMNSAHDIIDMFKRFSWLPHNIFMGPSPVMRSHDPGEKLDRRHDAGGAVYAAAKIAEEIDACGFANINADAMAIKTKTIAAHYNYHFIDEEWLLDKEDRLMQRGGVSRIPQAQPLKRKSRKKRKRAAQIETIEKTKAHAQAELKSPPCAGPKIQPNPFKQATFPAVDMFLIGKALKRIFPFYRELCSR